MACYKTFYLIKNYFKILIEYAKMKKKKKTA